MHDVARVHLQAIITLPRMPDMRRLDLLVFMLSSSGGVLLAAAEPHRHRHAVGAGTGRVRPQRHRRSHDPGHRQEPARHPQHQGRRSRSCATTGTLTLEVWYPATLARGSEAWRRISRHHARPGGDGHAAGKAVRDAAVQKDRHGTFPLVIISHGYPGNRFLMSHIGENLASKGFVMRLDRSQGQHLRRSEGVRQHALQPAVRSAVRPE